MTRHLVVSALLAIGMASSVARAAPVATYRWTDATKIGSPWTLPEAANVSHIIYMNNCTGGCTLHPGNDNSTTNTSSIPNGTSSVAAYAGTAAQWQQLVACVRATYAPFNVQVVTDRPAAGMNYHMAIVAGTPQSVGESNGVLGVSPFSCGYIPNSISFTFANVEPSNINDLCWTVAQETAHSWGLDHKYDNRDPMTYLQTGPAMKTFQNSAGSCGEYSARTCSCTYASTGNQSMNSYALIMATFGPAGSGSSDTTAPTVAITSPTDGASVQPGFTIKATISDDTAVAKAELKIDGTSAGMLTAAPWQWTAPASLATGAHTIEVTASDAANNVGQDSVNVTIGGGSNPQCTSNSQCPTSDVCLNGLCVAGPGMSGGLGSPCGTAADCASGQCASDGMGSSYCTATCDPTKSGSCPSGFGCEPTGTAGGVCWPGSDNGGSGGCNTSGSNAPALLGLGLAGLLAFRRRRR